MRQNGQSKPSAHAAGPTPARRVVIVAAPGAEILDVVGPFQVFTTAAALAARLSAASAPLYRVEIATCSRGVAPGRYRQHFRGATAEAKPLISSHRAATEESAR